MDKDIVIPEVEHTDNNGDEPVLVNDSKISEEAINKERSFKEGLEDNSNTEKK